MSNPSDSNQEASIMAQNRKEQSKFREYSEALIVAVVLALIIRTFFVQAFKIPSGSMEDTLLVGDYLLVNKLVYGVQNPFNGERYLSFRDPERGDIIVFEFPEDTKNKSLGFWERKDFIKRLIGVPGDTLEVREKKVYVNGELYQIPQEVHKNSEFIPQRDTMAPVRVPEGMYFVMGDNRDNSFDSRFWGFVPKENVKGLAFIKYWSWDHGKSMPRFGRIGRPIH